MVSFEVDGTLDTHLAALAVNDAVEIYLSRLDQVVLDAAHELAHLLPWRQGSIITRAGRQELGWGNGDMSVFILC